MLSDWQLDEASEGPFHSVLRGEYQIQPLLYHPSGECPWISHSSRVFTDHIQKFLQALGYAASFDGEGDREERVQMHADKLYHQMLDHEKRADGAHAAGQEPPPLTSLFKPEANQHVEKSHDQTGPLKIPSGVQIPDGFRPSKDWEKLTPHERELEIKVHESNKAQQDLYVEKASPFMKSQEDARLKRQEKASSWLGETFGRWVT